MSIIKYLIYFLLLILSLGFLRSVQLYFSKQDAEFRTGKVPNPVPDGLYLGTVKGNTISWLGKSFDSFTSTGINIFDGKEGQEERYPFKTYLGEGIRNGDIGVLKIDYNIPENPIWMRIVLDEIVEKEPGHYLGKLNVRIVPGFPFTLTYFELKK